MRVQIETGAIRFRVDESELARLLSGEVIADVTTLPDGRVLRRVVRLHAGPPRFAVDWLDGVCRCRSDRSSITRASCRRATESALRSMANVACSRSASTWT